MILAALALVAAAAPPRGEVIAGWGGNADSGYGYVTALPALARSEDASLMLRIETSHLYYHYFDGDRTVGVDSPGAALGLAFRYAPGRVSYGFSTSAELRSTSRSLEGGEPERQFVPGATLGADVYWTPYRGSALYVMGTFSGSNGYLWTRAGGLHQAVPLLRRQTQLSLWFGLDGTARGNQDARVLETGAVVELHVRDWHGALSARAGFTVFEDTGSGPASRPTIGVGAYWSY